MFQFFRAQFLKIKVDIILVFKLMLTERLYMLAKWFSFVYLVGCQTIVASQAVVLALTGVIQVLAIIHIVFYRLDETLAHEVTGPVT